MILLLLRCGLLPEQAEAQRREQGDSVGEQLRRAADAHELMEIELQPEAEHEDYYADLAPCAYRSAVGDVKEEGHVRADQEAREYVAQDERLVQLFENDGDDAAGQKYDSKVGNKFRQMQY